MQVWLRSCLKEIPLATLVVLTGLKDIAGKYEPRTKPPPDTSSPANFAEGGGQVP